MIRRMLMQRAVERTDEKLQQAIVSHARIEADRHYYTRIATFYRDRASAINPHASATRAVEFAHAMQKKEDNEWHAEGCLKRASELRAEVTALQHKLNELKGSL